MNQQFDDQVVLVTGATRGIGREIAHAFAQKGAMAIIVGRDVSLGQKVCEEFRQKDLKVDFFVCDVTNLKNVEEMVDKILDKHLRIDILVNNAGVTKDNLLLRMTENDWDQVLNINLKGVFNCTKVVARCMLKAKKGKIINISSVIGVTGNAGQANYAASKAGIIGFSKSVARELASRGINVNTIAPGYIQTDMTDQLPEKFKEEILKKIPLQKFGRSLDVAGVCLFLASKEADYITGQTILVDGGMAI